MPKKKLTRTPTGRSTAVEKVEVRAATRRLDTKWTMSADVDEICSAQNMSAPTKPGEPTMKVKYA